MRPGRELDTRVAQEIFGHKVFARQKVLHEAHPAGDRPLRKYSKEMEWAWEVAEKMKISLIPIADGQWFAFVASTGQVGWESPQAFLAKLESGDFSECGAALGTEAPLVICQAAINAVEKRKHEREPSPFESAPLEPIPPELLN